MINEDFVLGLMEDEKTVIRWRKHWYALTKWIRLPLLFLLASPLIAWVVTKRLASLSVLWLLFCWLIILISVLIWIGWSWNWKWKAPDWLLDWRSDLCIATNKRVIRLVGQEVRAEAPLAMIQSITYEKDGLMANWLDFGDMTIELAGPWARIRFQGIPHPAEAMVKILRLMRYESPVRLREEWTVLRVEIPLPDLLTIDDYFDSVVSILKPIESIYSVFALVNSGELQAVRDFAAIENAYNALSPPLQELLNRLTVLRLPTSYDELEILSLFETQRDLNEGLEELVKRGLVIFDHERGIYDLSPVVQQYVCDRPSDRVTSRLPGISNLSLHDHLVSTGIQPLSLVSAHYGSPASFDVLGLGNVLETLGDIIKDLIWRGKHEKRLAELELREREQRLEHEEQLAELELKERAWRLEHEEQLTELELQRKQHETELMKHDVEKAIVETARQTVQLFVELNKPGLSDDDKQLIVSVLVPSSLSERLLFCNSDLW